jgi:hypothetical protein
MGELEAEVRRLIVSRVTDQRKGDKSSIEDVLAIPEQSGVDYGGPDAARWTRLGVELASGNALALVRVAEELDRLRTE